jgi:tRNA-modifying protein YgfZ
MNTATWLQFLESQGAVIDAPGIFRFRNTETELKSAENGTVLSDLSHWGLIDFSGEDAQNFLQGQLTSDVRRLNPAQASWAGYCTAKGRLLANTLLVVNDQQILMQLPQELREPIQKRLSMFILRSKVKIADAGDSWIRIGIAGVHAAELISARFGPVPEKNLEVARHESAIVVKLSDRMFELLLPPAAAPDTWQALTESAAPVGKAAWDWLMIRAGLPFVFPATQDQFVPQMLNLELIGGVSFKKGCYPGQEIVARTQYLGKVKRRMFAGHLAGDVAPLVGDALYSPTFSEQSIGQIVMSAPAPEGGYDLLLVSQTEAPDWRWKSPEGPVLERRPLPYAIP